MRVLALVPADAADRIALALGRAATVVRPADVDQLLHELATPAGPAVIVVDPRLVSPEGASQFTNAVRRVGAPVVAYTALSTGAMRALLPVAAAGVREVIVRGVDDDAVTIRRLVGRLARETLGGRVLARLVPALRPMPPALRDAVAAMFVHPGPMAPAETPDELAARAGLTRRSLDRWIARCGIVSSRLLVAAPQLVLAYDQLRRPESSVASVAARLGYSSPRRLEEQCAALLRVRPSALRGELEPQHFVDALARGLLASRPAETRMRRLPRPRQERRSDP